MTSVPSTREKLRYPSRRPALQKQNAPNALPHPVRWFSEQVPWEYRERRREYVDLVIHEMLPAVANEKLRDVQYIDGIWYADYRRLRIVAQKL